MLIVKIKELWIKENANKRFDLGDFFEIYEESLLYFLLSLIQNQDDFGNLAHRRIPF